MYYNYGPLPTSGTTTTADADASFQGASNNRLGSKVFGLDDYDGNGYPDIGVMAGFNDSSTTGATSAYTGQFSVFSGVYEIE